MDLVDDLAAALRADLAWHDSRFGPGGDAQCHTAARAALARYDADRLFAELSEGFDPKAPPVKPTESALLARNMLSD